MLDRELFEVIFGDTDVQERKNDMEKNHVEKKPQVNNDDLSDDCFDDDDPGDAAFVKMLLSAIDRSDKKRMLNKDHR